MGTSIRLKANLLIKPTQARRQWDNIFKMLKTQNEKKKKLLIKNSITNEAVLHK